MCNSKTNKIILTVTLLLLSVTHAETAFNRFDKNGDNKIELDEYIVYKKYRSEEIEKEYNQKIAERKLRNCDTNLNGQIDLNETSKREPSDDQEECADAKGINLQCPVARYDFDKYDSNHDGVIGMDELIKREGMASMFIAYSDGSDEDTNLSHTHNKQPMYKNLELEVAKFSKQEPSFDVREFLDYAGISFPDGLWACDSDGDANISMEEMTTKVCGFTKEEFGYRDFNQDGVFSQEDIEFFVAREEFKRVDLDGSWGLDISEFGKDELLNRGDNK